MQSGISLSSRVVLVVAVVVGGCVTGMVATMVNSAHEPKGGAAARTLATEDETSEQRGQERADLSHVQCGRNALYMLLRRLGHDVSYDEIERNVPVGPKGSSLLELRDGARQLGVELSICKYDPTFVEAIRHTRGIALVRQGNRKDMGHYVVTEPIHSTHGGGRIDTIGGSYGIPQRLTDYEFALVWTGYYLTGPPSVWKRWLLWATAVSMICLLGSAAWSFRHRSTGRAGRCTATQDGRHSTEV